MDRITDRDTFEREALAAAVVFRYLRSSPALRLMQLQFEFADVDPASSRAVVKFSCRPPHRHTVWVRASTRPDDSWVITHSFTW